VETLGTWLVMIGSALAVLQAVWVIVATGRQRSRLNREKARSEAREAQLAKIEQELRERWGDDAADMGNYEDMRAYQSEPDLDRLRAERATLRDQRVRDDWVRTYANFGREKATKDRELDDVDAEWKRLWTHGVPGLVGGVMALVGGALIAFGAS
jgi:hypothetical protein